MIVFFNSFILYSLFVVWVSHKLALVSF